MVWGRTSTAITRALGVLVQGAALAAAGFAASSRVSDGVHYVEDVVVGSTVGVGVGSAGPPPPPQASVDSNANPITNDIATLATLIQHLLKMY